MPGQDTWLLNLMCASAVVVSHRRSCASSMALGSCPKSGLWHPPKDCNSTWYAVLRQHTAGDHHHVVDCCTPPQVAVIGCVLLLTTALLAYFFSGQRPVYLVDFYCYRNSTQYVVYGCMCTYNTRAHIMAFSIQHDYTMHSWSHTLSIHAHIHCLFILTYHIHSLSQQVVS